MSLNLTKVNIDNIEQYSDILTSQKLKENTEIFNTNNLEDIEDSIGDELNSIIQNNRSLLLFPINTRDRLTSNLYNMIIDGIDQDIRNVTTGLSKIVNVLNKTTETLNSYNLDFTKQLDNRSTELKNIEVLEDSNLKFNHIITDTFTEDSNKYTLNDRADKSENSQVYKLKTFNEDVILSNNIDIPYTINILNDNVSKINDIGNIYTKFIDNAQLCLSSSDEELSFSGKIGNQNITYNGLVCSYIFNIDSNKMANHISFNKISSHDYDVIGVYYSGVNETRYDSNSWIKIQDDNNTTEVNTRYELNFETQNILSLMLVIGQKSSNRSIIGINTDQVSNMLNNIENSDIKNNININEIYREKLIDSNVTIKKNNDIDYKKPEVFKNISKQLYVFLNSILGLFKPEKPTYYKNTTIYDFGMYNFILKLNEYEPFSIYESESFKANGNILSCDFIKNDKISKDTFIKYFIQYESTTRRVLGINDKTTADIFIVRDTSNRLITLDFLSSGNIEFYINGTLIDNTKYTLIYSDINNNIISQIQLNNDVTYRFGDIVKIEYDISLYDNNYNNYTPQSIDFINELGRPNIRTNKKTNGISSQKVILINEISGDLTRKYIPLNLNTSVKKAKINNRIDDEPENSYFVLKSIAEDSSYGINPTVFDVDDFHLEESDILYKRIDESKTKRIELNKSDVYRGIIDELITSISGENNNMFETNHEYIPGTLIAEINDKKYEIDEYNENATNLKKASLRTKKVLENETLLVSYVPIDNTVDTVSNIANFNKTEIFNQLNDEQQLLLSSHPFIDYKIVNESNGEDNWTEVDNTFILNNFVSESYTPFSVDIGGIKAKNITNYSGVDENEFSEYIENHRNYEYKTKDNILTFNTNINDEIIVKYYTLGSNIKLQAELYRNNIGNQTVTPELHDYSLLLNIGGNV